MTDTIWRFNDKNGMYEFIFDNWIDGIENQTVMYAARINSYDGRKYDPEYNCVHFYRICNGAMTMGQNIGDVESNNIDYLHICDLDEFISDIKQLSESIEKY